MNLINVNAESLLSDILLLKWFLISLRTEKDRSASTDETCYVQPNASSVRMLGNASVSAWARDCIKQSGRVIFSIFLSHP